MTKKQAIKIFIFILLVLFILVHLTYVLRTNGDVKDRFVGFYWEKRDTLDAVIIGSSPVPACIATPKIYGDMGITVYPVSSNMQRPIATKYLVGEILKTQSPELFIFEMRMWIAEDENLLGNMAHTREVTDNMKYSLNRVRTIDAMVPKEDRLSYYFDIFKYHSNWKTMFLWSQLRTAFYSYPDDLKGYVIETEVGPAELPAQVSGDEKEPMPKEQEKYLLELIDYLKEKDLNALFIITPYSTTDEEEKKINYMKELIANKGYPFLDMNSHIDEIGLNFEEDIRDYGTHTNVSGAEKVTDFFERYIKENYIDKGELFLKDHRKDNKYASWDEAYDKYLSEYETGMATLRYNIDNGIYYSK